MSSAPVPGIEDLAPEVAYQAQRGRGPGGQNVNKVASCALISWDFQDSRLLTAEQKARIATRLATAINSRGALQLRSDEFRDLERNKARALEKLAERVAAALFIPKPRKATKPTRASKMRLQEAKTHRSEAKRLRTKKIDW